MWLPIKMISTSNSTETKNFHYKLQRLQRENKCFSFDGSLFVGVFGVTLSALMVYDKVDGVWMCVCLCAMMRESLWASDEPLDQDYGVLDRACGSTRSVSILIYCSIEIQAARPRHVLFDRSSESPERTLFLAR